MCSLGFSHFLFPRLETEYNFFFSGFSGSLALNDELRSYTAMQTHLEEKNFQSIFPTSKNNFEVEGRSNQPGMNAWVGSHFISGPRG